MERMVQRLAEFRSKMVRRTFSQYMHFVFNNPRAVCRIMASLNVMFLSTLCALVIFNICIAKYSEPQLYASLVDEDGNVAFGVDFPLPLAILNENKDKMFITSLYHLGFTFVMLLVNICLLRATFKRNLYSIFLWLFAHTTHMLYSLSINLYVGVSRGCLSLIYLGLFNTFLYLLFISLVALFWFDERYSCIQNRTNDKTATSQERMA